MRPEIEGRCPTDALLQQTEVDVGNLIVRHRLWGAGDEPEGGLIVAATGTLYVEIEDGVTCLASQSLGTRQHGRVVVQKLAPVVDIVPEGHLIRDIADHHGTPFLTVLDDAPQRLCHRDAHSPLTFAQLQRQAIELLVLQHVVDLGTLCLGRHPEGQRCHPFPVAVVTQIDGTRLSAIDHFVNDFRPLEHHPPPQLGLAHREQFDGFHQVVAEPMVESLLQPVTLCIVLLGETISQMLADEGHTIAHQPIYDQVDEV